MNVNTIASRVNRNFLRGNRFQVSFGLGQIVDHNCCAVAWPNITYGTFNWKNAGPNIKVPYEPTFDEVRFEFYCDHDGEVPSRIRKWNRDVMDESFRFKFYSEYVRDIEIREYNTSGVLVHKKRLVNAWPISVEPVQLGFELTNQIERIACLVSYEYSEDIG